MFSYLKKMQLDCGLNDAIKNIKLEHSLKKTLETKKEMRLKISLSI